MEERIELKDGDWYDGPGTILDGGYGNGSLRLVYLAKEHGMPLTPHDQRALLLYEHVSKGLDELNVMDVVESLGESADEWMNDMLQEPHEWAFEWIDGDYVLGAIEPDEEA